MSCHWSAVVKAIPAGVFTRLGRLTSIKMDTINKPITALYPAHTSALTNAGILLTKVPMLKELKAEEILWQQKKLDKVEDNNNNDYRKIYFVIGHSPFWASNSILQTIQKFWKKHALPFLRVSMAYRRYMDLWERFCGNLLAKLNKDVESLDFKKLLCNCYSKSKVNNCWAFKGGCHTPCIVYQATCKIRSKVYIRCTQKSFKQQMSEHFSDMSALTTTNPERCKRLHAKDDPMRSDTFAKHC